MPAALASRYARALVDVVTSPTSQLRPEAAVEQLKSFQVVLEGSQELRNALSSPAVAPARKRAVVSRLAESLSVNRVIRNFLLVVVDHRRSGVIAEMVHAFEALLDERLGIVQADVRAAHDLDQPEQTSLARELSRLTGKQVHLKVAVDPELIGGVVARIGSTVYDGSVRGQLDAMGRRLRA